MASSLIGSLRVALGLDTAQFEAGANKAATIARQRAGTIEGAFKTATTAVTGLFSAFAVGALTDQIKKSLDYAGSIAEIAKTLGVTNAQLQEYRYAATQSGVAQEQLETGLRKLNQTMGQAEAGGKAQTKAFEAIGISVDDLKGKNAGDVFKLIADGLEKIPDRAQRAAVEVALFGKAGATLDNLLSGGSARINELSDAAKTLGIVLSDEQIRGAEETAHKLEALKTVLEANVASAVTSNADAILGLARAIETLVGLLPGALRSYRAFAAGMELAGGALKAYDPTNTAQGRSEGRVQMVDAQIQLADLRRQQAGGTSLADRAAKFRQAIRADPKPVAGKDIPQFLAPKTPKARSARPKRAPTDRSEDVEFQFSQEEKQADEAILQAKLSLSHDTGDRAELSLAMLKLEGEARDAEIDHRVEEAKKKFADGQITKATLDEVTAQAAILKAKGDQADRLKATAILDDRDRQLVQDQLEIDTHWLGLRQDMLKKEEDLATTQAERRKIELQLLDLAYQAQKKAVEAAIRTAQNDKDREIAQQDLQTLNANHALDHAGVIQQTRGPLEQWAASVPHTAAEINEAIQSIEVEGLDGLSDGLAKVIDGTESLKSAFHDLAASVLEDILKMTIKMLLFRAISAIGQAVGGGVGGGLGGGSGIISSSSGASFSTGFVGLDGFRAAGGPVAAGKAYLVGEKRPEIFVPDVSGMIIPRVEMAHRTAANLNMPDSVFAPSVPISINIDATGADPAGLSRVQAQLTQLKAELPGQVLATMQDARDRFIWRGR